MDKGAPQVDGLSSATPIEPVPVSPVPASIPSAELFRYSDRQEFNIHVRHHPDCGVDPVCAFCGATEESGGGVCYGPLTGLALDLFQEAACSARNANIKSIGQITNWRLHDRHARTFDEAARFVAAQAMSAGTAETQSGSGRQPASAVGSADAPQPHPHKPHRSDEAGLTHSPSAHSIQGQDK